MQPKSSLGILLAILPTALWGAVFVAVKEGERAGLPSLEFAAGRALPAGIVLCAIALIWNRRGFAVREHYGALAAMVASIAVMYGMTFVFATKLPVAVDALLGNASPLFAVPLAAIFLHEKVSLLRAIGVVLGACGVAAMALPELRGAPADFWAMMAMFSAALMLAINTIFMKVVQDVDPIVANGIQMLVAGLLLLGCSAAFGEHLIVPSQAVTIGGIAYVSLAATAFAYVLWMRAVALLTVSRISVLLFLVPVFGLLWGWLFLRETISPIEALGSILVIIGIVFASA